MCLVRHSLKRNCSKSTCWPSATLECQQTPVAFSQQQIDSPQFLPHLPLQIHLDMVLILLWSSSHSPSSYYQLCSKDMNLGSYHLCEYSQPGYLRQGSDEIERLSNDWCSVCVCVCVTSCCRWHRNTVPLLSGLSSSMTWYETMCPIRYDVVYQWNAVSLVQLLDRRNCCMV